MVDHTPVVLVGGVGSTTRNWSSWVRGLDQLGIEAFPAQLSKRGFASIESDLAAVQQAVEGALAATGASKVHLVGHSKGGVVAVEFMRQHPDLVDNVVTVASPLRGSWLATMINHASAVPGLRRAVPQFVHDLSTGSRYLQTPAPELAGRITSIHARSFDGIVTGASARLPGARNIVLRGAVLQQLHNLQQTHNEGVFNAARGALGAA